MNELWKMTAHQIREGKIDKVILPLGSSEAHGEHMTEGTDMLTSYLLAKRIADKLDGLLVLPPLTYGYSGHYDSFPFSLTFSYDTTIAAIYDILESCLRQGINKIIMINSHDGNISAMDVASRKIKEKYPDARIASMDGWWMSVDKLLPMDTWEVWDGLGHAGEKETSMGLYLFPEYCEPELAGCVVPDNLPSGLDMKWDFAELSNIPMTGDATKGTAEKGRMMVEALVDSVVRCVNELDKKDWDYTTTGSLQKLR